MVSPRNPALSPRPVARQASTAPTPPAAPPAATTGDQPDAAAQVENLPTADDEDAPLLRGYIVVRRPIGEGPSYVQLADGLLGWTWEKERATVFKTKKMAEPLLVEKSRKDGITTPAGVAAGQSAKIEKFDPNADDED